MTNIEDTDEYKRIYAKYATKGKGNQSKQASQLAQSGLAPTELAVTNANCLY